MFWKDVKEQRESEKSGVIRCEQFRFWNLAKVRIRQMGVFETDAIFMGTVFEAGATLAGKKRTVSVA